MIALSPDPVGLAILVLALIATAAGGLWFFAVTYGNQDPLGAPVTAALSLLSSSLVITICASVALLARPGVALAFALPSLILLISSSRYLESHRQNVKAALRQLGSEIRETAPTMIGFVILAGVQVAFAFVTLSRVGDVGWDAATYHLPIVGSVIQEGSLFSWPDLRSFVFYPAMDEVQATLVGLALGSVHVASVMQVFYWALAIWLVGTIVARHTTPLSSLAAMAVAAAIPTAWVQARTLHEDVTFAAVLLAAGLTAVAAVASRRLPYLLMAALFTGALFGIKLGAPAGIPIAVVIVGLALAHRPFRRSVPVVALLGVLATTPYIIRNTVEHGLPFFPISLSIPNDPVDEYPGQAPYSINGLRWFVDQSQRPDAIVGAGTLEALWFQYVKTPTQVFFDKIGLGEEQSTLWARFDARYGGLGFGWLALVVAGAVAGAVAAAKRAPPGGTRLALGLGILAALSLAITQASWWPRFVIGAGLLAVVAAAMVLPRRRVGHVVASALLAVSLFMLVHAELDGGLPYWTSCGGGGCVADAKSRRLVASDGLSGRTLAYAPLAALGPERVVVVGPDPNVGHPYFPVGLWSPDWRREVVNLVIGSASEPGRCEEAYVVRESDGDWFSEWLAESDPSGSYDWLPWEDPGGVRSWVLRSEPCPGPPA